MVAPGGACVVALGGWHVWLLQGVCGCSRGYMVCSQEGRAWLLRGACVVAPGGCVVAARGVCMVALGGACMGYDEIQRYDQ